MRTINQDYGVGSQWANNRFDSLISMGGNYFLASHK